MALAHKMVKIKKCVFFSFNLAQNFHIVLNILDAYSGVSKYTLYIWRGRSIGFFFQLNI